MDSQKVDTYEELEEIRDLIYDKIYEHSSDKIVVSVLREILQLVKSMQNNILEK